MDPSGAQCWVVMGSAKLSMTTLQDRIADADADMEARKNKNLVGIRNCGSC
jgi:hypothetical protein